MTSRRPRSDDSIPAASWPVFLPCRASSIVSDQDRAIQQPADPLVSREFEPTGPAVQPRHSPPLQASALRRRPWCKAARLPRGVGQIRSASARASSRSGAGNPSDAFTRSVAFLMNSARIVLHQDMLGHQLFELVQHPPPARVQTQRERAFDPSCRTLRRSGRADRGSRASFPEARARAATRARRRRRSRPCFPRRTAPCSPGRRGRSSRGCGSRPEGSTRTPACSREPRPGDRIPRAACPRNTRSS